MEWKFRGDQPIYAQLVERIKLGVVSGDFPPGARLQSVRDLATEAGVNPNTMQRALQELEREGILYTQRTAGRFVTEDRDLIRQTREKLAQGQIQAFLEAMSRLGCSREEIVRLLEEEKEESNGNSGM